MANAKKQQNQKKEKMVLFKSKNEAVLAVVVVILFIGACIYNVAAYYGAQMPSGTTSTTTVSPTDPNLDPVARDLAAEQAGTSSSGAPALTQPTPDPNSPAGFTPTDPNLDPVARDLAAEGKTPISSTATTSADGGFPLFPVILVVVLALIAFAVMKYMPKDLAANLGSSGSSNSGAKKGKKGQQDKFVLAKNKNELMMMVGVLVLLVGVSLYNIVKYFQGQQTSQASTAVTQEEYFAQKQKAGLESLNSQNPNGQVPVDPNTISSDANDIYSKTLELQGQNPSVSTNMGGMPQQGAGAGSEIDIISKGNVSQSARKRNFSSKMVMIPVSESGRSNPFLPAAENVPPSTLPKFSVLPPPEGVSTGSDADNVMGTTISGILYDKYSPSAIITTGGNDYLVKKGDLINRYKILSITKEEVVVQLGSNIYKAGVGQLLVKSSLNFNTISNLNKKFAGNEVPVNVRKKR